MLESGLLAEVERLFTRGDLHPDLPSIRCVGYRQAWAYLAGEDDYAGMVAKAVSATRQLAKRQTTWLRQWERAERLESLDPHLLDRALKFLHQAAIN
jgi:tRNA dimethylallyltransferase